MASKKKIQIVDETPVTAPLFAKHHYLILESADGHVFYVDRNAAVTSRVIAAALKELGNRADEASDDALDTNAATAVQQTFAIMGGDVEVICNGEKAATTSAQLPIVYPGTLMAATLAQHQQQQQGQAGMPARPGTGDNNQGVGRGVSAPQGGPSGGKNAANSKLNQQLIAQQELLAAQLVQYQQVDAALNVMASLPLTHLRLVHINGPILELAIRFMQYKYKNDSIADAEARQGFFALTTSRSYPSPQNNGAGPFAPHPPSSAGGSSFGAFGAFGGNLSMSGVGVGAPSSPSKRKSLAANAAQQQGPAAPPVDPITGGGIVHLPQVGTMRHMELLAVSTLLQL